MSIASLWSSDLNKRPQTSIVTCKLLWPSKVCTVFGFRSVRFARYSALEFADSRDPFAWHRRRYRSTHPGQLGYAHVETSQQELRQLPQEQRPPGKRASTPRSRHENGHLAQRGLIRLWRRSSRHVQEPWLTTITGSGADSSNSRMVADMASLERRRLMS